MKDAGPQKAADRVQSQLEAYGCAHKHVKYLPSPRFGCLWVYKVVGPQKAADQSLVPAGGVWVSSQACQMPCLAQAWLLLGLSRLPGLKRQLARVRLQLEAYG